MSNLIVGDYDLDPAIYRVYVGAKNFKFPNIADTNVPTHIILAFAHETYNVDDGKGTGKFHADWDQSVKDIKQKYPDDNQKVLFSIGGRDAKYPFSPIDKDDWCKNAVNSLKTIIQQYNFDGIDINYQHIDTDNEHDFSNYVGDVITELKKEKIIVSIAPSHETHEHYKLLYNDHSDDIDWVNYQFYMETLPKKDEFGDRFHRLSEEYSHKKLLVGASVIDPRDIGNLPLDVFREGCIDLFNRKSLSGIFIWNVNDSNPEYSSFSCTAKISLDIDIETPIGDFHYHCEWP